MSSSPGFFGLRGPRLRNGMPGGAPLRHSSTQDDDISEAGGAQDLGSLRGALVGVADERDPSPARAV